MKNKKIIYIWVFVIIIVLIAWLWLIISKWNNTNTGDVEKIDTTWADINSTENQIKVEPIWDDSNTETLKDVSRPNK